MPNGWVVDLNLVYAMYLREKQNLIPRSCGNKMPPALQCCGDGCAGGGEHSGHLRASERKEMLQNICIKLRAARL